jgi:mono/diheme cytochrome c family protein
MRSAQRVFIAIMAAFALGGQAVADEDLEKAIERGNAHYLLFCANCHGVDGDGQGPLRELLKVTPSDLRYIRKDGGELAARVLRALDGRHAVGEHAERKMPVFTQNLEVRTIIEITDYLNAIQK